MKNKFTSCIAALCFLAVVGMSLEMTGCKQPPTATQVAYSTLDGVGASVDASMKAAASLRASGAITSAQWQTVADAHAKYLAAYNAAVDGAAVALDQASVPANVASLATDVLNIVASFKK